MRTLIAVLLAGALSGCATFQDVATRPTTFAVCKTADVASTAVALHSGRFVESNSFLTALGGAHSVLPAALIGVGLWWALKNYAPPMAVAGANVITCGVAGHNAWVFLK